MTAAFVIPLALVSCGEKKVQNPVADAGPAVEQIQEVSGGEGQVQSVAGEEKTVAADEEVKSEQKPAEEAFPVQTTKGLDFKKHAINPYDGRDERMSYVNGSPIVNGVPEFYFLGWSKTGKIAFIMNTYLDGVGGNRIDFIVQDTVTDEILYNNSSLLYDEGDGSSIMDDYKEMDRVLAQYKIILQAPDYMEPTKTNRDGPKGAAVWFGVEASNVHEDEMGTTFLDYVCTAYTGDALKVVTSEKNAQCSNVYVCGYLRSPYENRIALILGNTVRGFEGCDIAYKLSGCHMDVGF